MKYKCNKCQSDMLDKSKGPYLLYVCPICGNSFSSYDYSHDSPMKYDQTIYTIKSTNNTPSLNAIKLISKVTGLNYNESKRIIENNSIILSGKAIDIIDYLKEFKTINFLFEIEPEFNYEI